MLNKKLKIKTDTLVKLVGALVFINILTLCLLIVNNLMFYRANFTVTHNQTNININETHEKININTCSLEALDTLGAIGKAKAKKIIDNRPYKDIYELRKVIGDNSFNAIKNNIMVGEINSRGLINLYNKGE